MRFLARTAVAVAVAGLLLASPARAEDTPAPAAPAVVAADEPSVLTDGSDQTLPPPASPAETPAPAPAASPAPAEPSKPGKPSSPGKPSKPGKPNPEKPSATTAPAVTEPGPVDLARPQADGSAGSASCADVVAGASGTPSTGCQWPTVPVPSNPGSSPLPPGQLLPGAYTQADAAAVTAAQEEVARLRGLVATASQESMAADAARDEALEAARLAHWEALMSNVRAEQARRLLARYAAGVYRSGGGSTGLVTIVNGALDDPGAVLDEQAYLRRAADQKSSEVEQARQVLEEARELAAAADTAEQEAQQAAATAAAARTELADALAQAREQLRIAESSAVSAQTLIGPDGCPTQVPAGTLRGSAAGRDVADLCARSVASAATPEAALAIKFAFRSLGAPYACKGIGRSLPFRFDCSSLVSRAYSEGAGLNTAGDGWAPSTRDMVPWDGVPLAPWAAFVAPDQARPGDIVLYDTGGAIYRHVVMLVADGLMLHTNSCGDVAKVEDFWGFGTPTATYLVSRRVDPEKAR